MSGGTDEGVCVNIFTETDFVDKYNTSITNKENNKLCYPSDPNMPKDCCLCMIQPIVTVTPSPTPTTPTTPSSPTTPSVHCEDTGCFEHGGECLDLKIQDLTDKNAYPYTAVNLNKRVTNGTTELCVKSNGEKNCCECYERV